MARPKYDIDPKKVITMASDGAKVVEIADYFGVSRDVIHDRFATELTKGRAALRTSLRASQIKAARQGNSTMLIWLGKQYLGQSDATIDDYLMEAINAAGLTKEDLIELINRKDAVFAGETKRTFEEFCKSARYPDPFPKQMDMVRFALDHEETRLLLGSRGYGKTDYITILVVAYLIYLDPGSFSALIVTKSKDRNTAILKEIQTACMLNGVTFERANATHLRARGLQGKDQSVSAVTLKGASLRGRHPKLTIMDDPVTEDDTSEAARELAKKKYYEIMKLVQNVILIGQPAHQYDLYADIRGIVKTLEVPHGSIPELDHDLEAMRLAGVDEASISASYRLKILSEGTSPFNAVKYVQSFPSSQGSVAFIDPSEGGDYTAITIMTMVMQSCHVVGFVRKKAWNHCLDEFTPLLERFGVKKLAFETNCTGEQPIGMLQKLWPRIGIVGRRANNNKHSRIMAAGSYAHLIHLSKESDKLYTDHVVKYEYKSKFDDAPDSLASLLEWVGLIRGKA